MKEIDIDRTVTYEDYTGKQCSITPRSVIADVVRCLADAFGGHSQYTDAHVGEAVAGRMRNGGSCYGEITPEEYTEAYLSWVDDRWYDLDLD